MTDLRKAAEMALEALEELQGGCTDSDDGTVEALTIWCPEVIEALRQALAEPVDAVNMSQERVDETAKRGHEPVAWVKLETWLSGETWPDDCFSHFECTDCVPLYTAPPKREWVGLTDEDKDAFWRADQMTSEEWDELFAAVEAKLKEKNTC